MAQPIESRVIGVDNMLYMKSTSGNDGSYTLTVTFAVGTDPDINTVNVQNRVGLAEPQLPHEVKAHGRQRHQEVVGAAAGRGADSPDERYDQLFLSNYATINIIDNLKRVNGVGDAILSPPLDYSMRVWLDTAADQLRHDAERHRQRDQAQNIQAAVGRIGAQPSAADQQFQLNIQTQGRLTTVEEFG